VEYKKQKLEMFVKISSDNVTYDCECSMKYNMSDFNVRHVELTRFL
jgi:hypothetical protein